MNRFARRRTLVLTFALAGLAWACSDTPTHGSPLAPSFSRDNAAHADAHYHLVLCSIRLPRVSSALIGAAGGELQVGPNRLVVPPGALNTPTRLSGFVLPLEAVNMVFGPEGLQFALPAQLTLNTAGCAIPLNATPSIVYVKDGQIAEVIPSTFDRINHKIIGPIRHFSGYSVAFHDEW